MAVETSKSRRRISPPAKPTPQHWLTLVRTPPIRRAPNVWALLGAALVVMFVSVDLVRQLSQTLNQPLIKRVGVLAPLFSPEVHYWEPHIQRWAEEHNVEPNLIATVMQIESCGHPTVSSYAGAQGLFQVMPFHFASDENMLDPNTNALRGTNFIKECLRYSEGDIGLALACYNGGPSVVFRSSATWHQQVKDYYHWGTGIYADALTQKAHSETLSRWMAAGGSRLCASAAAEIGLR